MRARLHLALASVGVLIATVGLAALLLSGCASSSVCVGAAMVSTSGLGYEPSYPEASLEASGGERFAWRAAAHVARSEKRATGDGFGYGGAALAGARFGDVVLLAGPAWSRQETSTWSKSERFLRAELDWQPRGQELRLWHDWRGESVAGLPGGQVRRVLGVGYRTPGRLALDLAAERVWFLSWGEPAPPGTRWSVGALWRLGGR